jgi:hypothetical protein
MLVASGPIQTPSMQTNIRQTLVIPAHNEEWLRPRLLDTVEVARAPYSFGAGAIEVILADNGSTDRTAKMAGGALRRIRSPNASGDFIQRFWYNDRPLGG